MNETAGSSSIFPVLILAWSVTTAVTLVFPNDGSPTSASASHVAWAPALGDARGTVELATAVVCATPVRDRDLRSQVEPPGENAALDAFGPLPTSWDETRLFRGGRAGEVAAVARRRGEEWFLAGLNGATGVRTASFDLSFLGEGAYRATLVRDDEHAADGTVLEDSTKVRTDTLTVRLEPAGGFVARFRPTP